MPSQERVLPEFPRDTSIVRVVAFRAEQSLQSPICMTAMSLRTARVDLANVILARKPTIGGRSLSCPRCHRS